MKLKERIQDIFKAYSIDLEVTDEVVVDVVEEKDKEDEVALAEKTLANGTVIYTDAEDFVVGSLVFIVNEEGERMPLPDGEYEYEGGGKTVVTDGAIAEVLEEDVVEEEVKEEEEVEVEMSFSKAQVRSMVSKAISATKDEFRKSISRQNLELKAMKLKLSTVRGGNGLRQSTNTTKRVTLKDMQQLSTKDRISAIHDLYLNKN
tara:strand:- start:5719 stop:6330 length:612 start_codon:yes stop_codon:yes gene_type:complete